MTGEEMHAVGGTARTADLHVALSGFETSLRLVEDLAPDLRQRRERDRALARAKPPQEGAATIHEAWLQVAPVLFPRALSRSLWKAAASG